MRFTPPSYPTPASRSAPGPPLSGVPSSVHNELLLQSTLELHSAERVTSGLNGLPNWGVGLEDFLEARDKTRPPLTDQATQPHPRRHLSLGLAQLSPSSTHTGPLSLEHWLLLMPSTRAPTGFMLVLGHL